MERCLYIHIIRTPNLGCGGRFRGSTGGARGEHEGAASEQGGAPREHMAETGLSARAERRGLSQQQVTYYSA